VFWQLILVGGILSCLMSPTRIVAALCGLVLGALLASTVALAAAPAPLPRRASDYSTGGFTGGLFLMYVIHGANPKVVDSWPNPPPAYSGPFQHSLGGVHCPQAKRTPGMPFPADGFPPYAPYVAFGFPGATFTLSHGRYRFSASETSYNVQLVGSSEQVATLNVQFTATVVSSSVITGTVTVTGAPCTSNKALVYRAKWYPSSSLRVSPHA
jgi:hypothetical protein